MVWDSRIFAFDYLFVKALHIICSEGRHKCTHLVQDATKRPDVALRIVGHITPNLRACIVGCASLSVAEAFLDNFRNVKISEFGLHVLEQKDVCTLHVAVENFATVEGAKAPNNLNKDVPYLLLLYVGFPLLVVADLLEYVSVVSVLHHQTETRGRLIDEGIAISNHVRVVDRGENSDLIEGISLFPSLKG